MLFRVARFSTHMLNARPISGECEKGFARNTSVQQVVALHREALPPMVPAKIWTKPGGIWATGITDSRIAN
jgi:hypothetical protein